MYWGVKDTEIAYIIVFDIYHNTVLQHEWKVKNNAINIPIADFEKRVYTLTIKSQVQRVAAKFYKQWCLIQTKSAAKYIDWII
ncbi:hypothetical protein [Maribacter antarcticus]|uniref:hypothetical protein n=1 Tax=Maribacter antarcticus TaxID=505250 RepID=UPI00047E8E8F|nr:hypothetical protein [Maribacter antarcticus]